MSATSLMWDEVSVISTADTLTSPADGSGLLPIPIKKGNAEIQLELETTYLSHSGTTIPWILPMDPLCAYNRGPWTPG